MLVYSGKFINNNAVTKMASQSSKSPELLAKYISVLLQKSSKNPEEAELEDTLNQCMIVFKYIEDKDVFQKFYSKMLAKRLVQHMSASDDAEASMISKLKQACGFEYTSKLQRMFQDIGVSKDLNENFKKHLANSGDPLDIDFSIQVLSSGSWPFQQSCVFSLPPELERCVNRSVSVSSKARLGSTISLVQVHRFLRRAALRPQAELALPHEQGGVSHQLLQEQVHPTGTVARPLYFSSTTITLFYFPGLNIPDVCAPRLQ